MHTVREVFWEDGRVMSSRERASQRFGVKTMEQRNERKKRRREVDPRDPRRISRENQSPWGG